MQKSKLYILTGFDNGEILDSLPFNSYEEAYDRMKSIYDDRTNGDVYAHLGSWGFNITYCPDGWEDVQMKMSIQTIPHPGVTVALPDGRRLHAIDKEDPGYPGIRIVLLGENQKSVDAMGILWAEYSEERDDPQYILSYDSGNTNSTKTTIKGV